MLIHGSLLVHTDLQILATVLCLMTQNTPHLHDYSRYVRSNKQPIINLQDAFPSVSWSEVEQSIRDSLQEDLYMTLTTHPVNSVEAQLVEDLVHNKYSLPNWNFKHHKTIH